VAGLPHLQADLAIGRSLCRLTAGGVGRRLEVIATESQALQRVEHRAGRYPLIRNGCFWIGVLMLEGHPRFFRERHRGETYDVDTARSSKRGAAARSIGSGRYMAYRAFEYTMAIGRNWSVRGFSCAHPEIASIPPGTIRPEDPSNLGYVMKGRGPSARWRVTGNVPTGSTIQGWDGCVRAGEGPHQLVLYVGTAVPVTQKWGPHCGLGRP